MTDSRRQFTEADQDALRRCLKSGAPDVFGAGIAEMRLSPFEQITSYEAYRLHVRPAGGNELTLFLKDFGTCLRRKNDPGERREREVAVYRDLLAGAGLGTARFYGSVMDEANRRLWMVLEYVDGTPVGYGPLGEGWAPGPLGLGRMHGHFASQRERLSGCDFLIRHSAAFFRVTAERALADVSRITPRELGRMDKLIRGYDRVVERMTADPPTLVQGGCRSSNILVAIPAQPDRICILDWEEASFGAPLFDVAHLLDGIHSPLLDRLLEAYQRGAAEQGMATPPMAEMKHLVECFRLHMAFNSLSRAVFKGYREADVLKLLAYAEGIGEVVYGANGAASPARSVDEDDSLAAELERIVANGVRREVRIDSWRREPSPFAVRGVFPIDTLHVSLQGGEDVTLFVKHLGPEQADHPDKQCREREWRLYEEWLSDDGLPVPRYYGSRRNARSGRRELYLEYVGDWSLKYQELKHWFPIPRHLARLHAYFAERAARLRSCDYLLHLDAAYFRRWAERAAVIAGAQSGGLAAVVAEYDAVAALLARQPETLVHNDLAPKNVLADRSCQPERVCFIDWEMAGVGCGLLDLVHLYHGLDPASERAMREGYCDELKGSGLLPAHPDDLERLFTACELHHTLYRIANSHLWSLPPERIGEWVREAQVLAAQVRAEVPR